VRGQRFYQERLVRGVANKAWLEEIGSGEVVLLAQRSSNHNPILGSCCFTGDDS